MRIEAADRLDEEYQRASGCEIENEEEEGEVFLAHHYNREWSASYWRCLLVNTRTFT